LIGTENYLFSRCTNLLLLFQLWLVSLG
jgi:hypothetical protein